MSESQRVRPMNVSSLTNGGAPATMGCSLTRPTTQPPPTEPPPDYDLACSHQHQILATAPEVQKHRVIAVNLYHFRPSALTKVTTVVLPSSDTFSIIKCCVPLGTVVLKPSTNTDLAKTLSNLLLPLAEPPPSQDHLSSQRELLTDMIAQLPDHEQGTRLRLFSFPVFSRSSTEIVPTNLVPVWKWVKPKGTYRKSEFWDEGLNHVLEDGEWNGGKDLTLLVGGVSRESLQDAADRGMKTPNFEVLREGRATVGVWQGVPGGSRLAGW